MGHGGSGGVVASQRHGSNIAETLDETIAKVIVGHVEHGAREDGSVIDTVVDFETVGEGEDLQLRKQNSGGGSDLVTLSEHKVISKDINGTLVNLGRDIQGLEEVSLGRIHAGGTSGDNNFDGRNNTSTSGGTDLE